MVISSRLRFLRSAYKNSWIKRKMLNRLFSKYSVTRPLNHISTLPYAKSSNIKILKVRSILWPLTFFCSPQKDFNWLLFSTFPRYGGEERFEPLFACVYRLWWPGGVQKIYLHCLCVCLCLCWCCTVFERQRWWWCSQSSSIISDLVSIRWIREVWILVNIYWGKRFELLFWSLQLTKVFEDWDMASSVPKTKRVRRKPTNATFTF